MSKTNKTLQDSSSLTYTEMGDSDTGDDNSDDGLKIVIKEPTPKKKVEELNESDKQIIETIESEIESTLEEKAAKSNLSANNVKNILKQVVTNEHVLAMLRQTENPDELNDTISVFEPKLTRSKAKELLTNSPVGVIPPIPWQTPKADSEVQALFTEELQEDSSGDEYIPAEEESEDDRDSSVVSETEPLPILLTPTKDSSKDLNLSTSWSEDGVFKIPPAKTKEQEDEAANIALRTRSKFSLSATPLEVIEEAFMPPDITTDMYDMDCCDEDWMEFLRTFTRPLEEVVKGAEDEEHDPEYNILADEEMDKVDREELRADKAVKVTRKELNELMAELFDYADMCDLNSIYPKENSTLCASKNESSQNQSAVDSPSVYDSSQQTIVNGEKEKDRNFNNIFDSYQMLLLEQQMRQHVQLLTQNFLLTYEHPNFHSSAATFKEYLYNLKFLSEGKKGVSAFLAVNLSGALDLINEWEKVFTADKDESLATKRHFEFGLKEAQQQKKLYGNFELSFPKLILKTISESNVFIYPHLLPRMPFIVKELEYLNCRRFTSSEDHLIALCLEQFIPHFSKNKDFLTRFRKVNMQKVCQEIQESLLFGKNPHKIYRHIVDSKSKSAKANPIKYYYQHQKAPTTVHYVSPLDLFGVIPPKYRPLNSLPKQWRTYISSITQAPSTPQTLPVIISPITGVAKPVLNCAGNSRPRKRKLQPKCPITSTPISRNQCRSIKASNLKKIIPILRKRRFLKFFKEPPPLHKLGSLLAANKIEKVPLGDLEKYFRSPVKSKSKVKNKSKIMLPSMPALNTPIKGVGSPEKAEVGIVTKNLFAESETARIPAQDELTTDKESGQNAKNPDLSNNPMLGSNERDTGNDNCVSNEKDNLDEINALMIASSTVKSTKKDLTTAEKKKAKLRKEQLANIAMLSPLDPNIEKEKRESFAHAYYEKLRETLDIEDYNKVMEIFNEDDTGDAVDLYKKIEPILCPKYQDMAYEFLLFLNHEQAFRLRRMIPFYIMNNMAKFLQKLEIYFKDQPSQVKKVYRSLVDLTESVDVTMEKVKSTILPLLKGNALLIDWFLQIFLQERPPQMLLNGPWEEIDVNKELSKSEEDAVCETLIVPDADDPYGGILCICSCHQIEDEQFRKRQQHCTKCGVKFIQGKIYIQTGRGLRPANVTFPASPHVDHTIRLHAKTTIQRKKNSSKRTTSPSKENHEDGNYDSDDDDKKKRSKGKRVKHRDKAISPKSIKSKKELSPKKLCDSKMTKVRSRRTGAKKKASLKNNSKNKTDKTSNSIKPGSASGQLKRTMEDAIDWGALPPPEDIKISCSESESCEDLSQDNTNDSDTDCSNSSSGPNAEAPDTSWTRDEDKIILETFQQKDNKEQALLHISEILKNRSVTQIKNRFQKLMILLQEMAGNS